VTREREDPARPPTFTSADPPRNFSLSVNERIRALTIGPPAYATRKKSIEDLVERHLETLVALYDARLAKAEPPGDDAMTKLLLDKAATFDLVKLNKLIATHNRYYPIEANLPVDFRTGDYLIYGRSWHPDEPWTATRFVAEARRLIDAR
jgi:hypothetical protein